MSKSAIYTVNSANATVSPGGVIALGNTVRRFGCCIRRMATLLHFADRAITLSMHQPP